MWFLCVCVCGEALLLHIFIYYHYRNATDKTAIYKFISGYFISISRIQNRLLQNFRFTFHEFVYFFSDFRRFKIHLFSKIRASGISFDETKTRQRESERNFQHTHTHEDINIII